MEMSLLIYDGRTCCTKGACMWSNNSGYLYRLPPASFKMPQLPQIYDKDVHSTPTWDQATYPTKAEAGPLSHCCGMQPDQWLAFTRQWGMYKIRMWITAEVLPTALFYSCDTDLRTVPTYYTSVTKSSYVAVQILCKVLANPKLDRTMKETRARSPSLLSVMLQVWPAHPPRYNHQCNIWCQMLGMWPIQCSKKRQGGVLQALRNQTLTCIKCSIKGYYSTSCSN